MNRLERYVASVASAFNVRSMGLYMIYGVVVGVVAGLGAVIFYVLCQAGLHFLLDMGAGYRPDHPFGEPPLFTATAKPFTRYLLILIPALGGLNCGYLV